MGRGSAGNMLFYIRPCRPTVIRFITCRKCSSAQPDRVRVRFAPSPTGFMHLGGLRTALYNYLFAKSTGGQFILRIEDTDQTRLVPGAAENLMACLRWAGIEPDEGPMQGGRYGPYVQSERLDLYNRAAESLLERGAAYRCFCSERRLDLLRKDAARRQERPRYDNACRSLSVAEVTARLRDAIPHTLRLKLETHPQPWHDLVHGPITHDVAEHEGDPILLKSDGFPTYHLANVVDDHHMQISHVLRGLEWQSSTTKHLLLFKAFGWTPPQYGHLPLMLSPDGTKLSKRQGDIRIDSLKAAGYLPGAVIDLLTMSGGGFAVSQQELPGMSLRQLALSFSVGRLRTSGARVELDRLADFNRARLRQLHAQLDRDAFCSELRLAFVAAREAATALRHAVPGDSADYRTEGCEASSRHEDEGTLIKMTDAEIDTVVGHVYSHFQKYVERIATLRDLTGPQFAYWWLAPEDVNLDDFLSKEGTTWTVDCLRHTADALRSLTESEFHDEQTTAASLKAVARRCCPKGVASPARYFALLRTSLSGRQEGPPVAEMFLHIGKTKTLERLCQATASLSRKTSVDARPS